MVKSLDEYGSCWIQTLEHEDLFFLLKVQLRNKDLKNMNLFDSNM